jgi:hypothetical protein
MQLMAARTQAAGFTCLPIVNPLVPSQIGNKMDSSSAYERFQIGSGDDDWGLVTRRLTLREPPLCHRRVLFSSLTIRFRLSP